MGNVATPLQQEASRQNGKLGGRPRKDEGHGELRRQRERAREEGRLAATENPRFWREVRDDSRLPLSVRMDAARELSDRYGDPRQQVTAVIGNPTDDAAKIFELRQWEPPPSYSETPPVASPNGDVEQPTNGEVQH